MPCQHVHKSRFVHHNERAGFIELAVCIIYVHNVCMKYGYARVSTDGQSVAAQIVVLKQAGATKPDHFTIQVRPRTHRTVVAPAPDTNGHRQGESTPAAAPSTAPTSP